MKETAVEKTDLESELEAEGTLERRLIGMPEFRRGLLWGVPRYGHPEGEVYKHVNEVNLNIDRLPVDADTRARLRLISLVHDTFTYLEDKGPQRDWSKHHGMLGRRFLEKYSDDEVVLDIVELHDEAYYCWRTISLFNLADDGERRLRRLLSRLGDSLLLYYLFFKCDTLTGDKIGAPLFWFEKNIPGIDLVEI